MKKLLPMLYIIIAAVLWGIISLFFRPLTNIGFTSLEIVFLRVSTAALGMGIYIAVCDPSLFRIQLKDAWMFAGSGILSLSFFNFCYFEAIRHLSVSVAAALLYTAPIFVMLLSAILFREHISSRKITAVLCTVIGCVCVTGCLENRTDTNIIGILYGLGSGIGYALYSIFGAVSLRKYKTQTITFYTFVVSALSVLPFSQPVQMLTTASVKPCSTVILTIGLGVGVCLVPYLFYTKGLEHIKPSNASVVATLEPIIAAVVGCVVFHEALSIIKAIGILLILVSIVILNVRQAKFFKK